MNKLFLMIRVFKVTDIKNRHDEKDNILRNYG